MGDCRRSVQATRGRPARAAAWPRLCRRRESRATRSSDDLNSSTLVDVDRVSQIFATRHGEPTWALWRGSLSVREGEFVCLIGPSGCGKTTLLHLVAGFIQPSEGSVRFDGKPVRAPGPERGV